MNQVKYSFGMIGLGTMGRNLLLNIADNKFSAIGFDRDTAKGELLEKEATPGTTIKAAATLEQMVQSMETPRKIMMLVPAGPIVDAVISDLLPLVSEGDIIIDGGNSHFSDTERRIAFLNEKKLHFVGMGVSGGEKGARLGPSIMPGGDVEAWEVLKPILNAVAAKVAGEPCVAYMGGGAAGQYVKMVHNGIEYAIMQLISEAYDFMKRGLGCSNEELQAIFKKWNEGELQSFLIEIISKIFLEKDPDSSGDLVDVILDKAGSKGTGKWTSQEAMNLPVAIPTIDISVSLRTISSIKEERVQASKIYAPDVLSLAAEKAALIPMLGDALFLSMLSCYAQGLAMLQKASAEKQMGIPMMDVVKIWRGGCIIRSTQLETYYQAYLKNPLLSNLLLDENVAAIINEKITALRKIVGYFATAKIAAGAFMSSLSYFEASITENMPSNLIQAQRDFFGAHTYQRVDKPGAFHTDWND